MEFVRPEYIAPYHPSSNGLAERAVRVVREGLKKQQGNNITDQLFRFLFQYRITPQTTGTAPAELLLGRKPRSRLDILKPALEERVHGKQQQQKATHDKRSKVCQFAVGERVFVQNHNQGDKWLPGIIKKASGPLSPRIDYLPKLPFRLQCCKRDQVCPSGLGSGGKRLGSHLRDSGNWHSGSLHQRRSKITTLFPSFSHQKTIQSNSSCSS